MVYCISEGGFEVLGVSVLALFTSSKSTNDTCFIVPFFELFMSLSVFLMTSSSGSWRQLCLYAISNLNTYNLKPALFRSNASREKMVSTVGRARKIGVLFLRM